MTFETNDLAIFGAPEGSAAPPPSVADRGPPSPQGTQLGATSVAAPVGQPILFKYGRSYHGGIARAPLDGSDAA